MQSQTARRRRGLLLTPSGLKKLRHAIDALEYHENYGEKFTLEALSERTRLDPVTIAKVLEAQDGVDKRTLDRFFQALRLELDPSDYTKPKSKEAEFQVAAVLRQASKQFKPRYDLSQAIDVSTFYERTEEIAQLERWILRDRCRLIAILGMGGMGKTALSVKLVQALMGQGVRSIGQHAHVKPSGSPFTYIVWKSLRNAPPIQDLLAELLQFLAEGQEVERSTSVSDHISQLLAYLQQHRCLLILDNVESILKSGSSTGYCCKGYEAYSELFKRIGETNHQSCLLLTSREKPRELALLEGEAQCVRSFRLGGLDVTSGRTILQAEGNCVGTDSEWRVLVEHYAGNPLALRMVSPILQLFERVSDFLEFFQYGNLVFEDIQDLLDQQFERLSKLEREVIYWIAIHREATSLAQLRDVFLPPIAERQLLEAVISLERRSLIEQVKPTAMNSLATKTKASPQIDEKTTLFTLQTVVMEYVTHHLIEQMCQEIQNERIDWFNRHTLVSASASNRIKEAQIRLILQPITHRLLTLFHSKEGIEARLAYLWEKTKTVLSVNSYLEKNILDLVAQLSSNWSHSSAQMLNTSYTLITNFGSVAKTVEE
ncbi:MAG: AAA family ATPase [Leptolyngbya sp. BL-A-14]